MRNVGGESNNCSFIFARVRRVTLALALAWGLGATLPAHAFISQPALDILDTAANIFYEASGSRRVGIEVEFGGITIENTADILQQELGGEISTEVETLKTSLNRIDDLTGKPVYNTIDLTNYVIKNSRIGTIVVKPDLNQTSDASRINLEDQVVEVVTEPLRDRSQVEQLETALQKIQKAGALGTTSKRAVATQMNLEIARGKIEDIKVSEIINTLRAYYMPAHQVQIQQRLRIPLNRQKFLGAYSDGFMVRLLDPDYMPTRRQLFDDFIYRQSMELLGDPAAWTAPIAKVRARLLAEANPVVPKVVKMQSIRISSLLMYLFPNDPMTEIIRESGWAKARPLIEFRDWNTDFDVVTPFKQAIGLMQGAEQYGYFNHDRLLENLSGIERDMIESIRNESNRPGRRGPLIFRYFLGDPDTIDKALYADQIAYYTEGKVGFISSAAYGRTPVVIPGESVVFHRRHFHRNNIMGKYNPGLINANLQQALENKLVEAHFWNEFAPGSMPTFMGITDVYRNEHDIQALADKLSERFPKGWVMKGAWDLGSEKNIITDDLDIATEVKSYLASDFDRYMQQTISKNEAFLDAAPEYISSMLKKHKNYNGWRISKLLKTPNLVLVQERVAIQREFRVEVLGGHVLGHGSTLDRYYYMYKYGVDGKKMRDYVPPPDSWVRKVEEFAQSAIDRLPTELRGTPFGMDIAILADGSLTMIESNAGGNSNFLFEEERESIEALGRFLKHYPEAVKNGEVNEGLSATAQMDFLRDKFKNWNLTLEKSYPKMQFTSDAIIDPDFDRIALDPDFFEVKVSPLGKGSCSESIAQLLSQAVERKK